MGQAMSWGKPELEEAEGDVCEPRVFFLDLPKEVIAAIGSYLSCAERCKMRQVCKALRDLFNEGMAWDNNYLKITCSKTPENCMAQIMASKKVKGAYIREQGREREVRKLLEKHKDTIQFLSFSVMTSRFAPALPALPALESLEIKFPVLEESPCFRDVHLKLQYLYLSGYLTSPITDLVNNTARTLKRVEFRWGVTKQMCETSAMVRAMQAWPRIEWIMVRDEHCHTYQCKGILDEVHGSVRNLNFRCSYCSEHPEDECFCMEQKRERKEQKQRAKEQAEKMEKQAKLQKAAEEEEQKKKKKEKRSERKMQREKEQERGKKKRKTEREDQSRGQAAAAESMSEEATIQMMVDEFDRIMSESEPAPSTSTTTCESCRSMDTDPDFLRPSKIWIHVSRSAENDPEGVARSYDLRATFN